MSQVQVTQVTLSQAGVQMLILDNEKRDNRETIARLKRDIASMQRRLKALQQRQEEIEFAEFQANQLSLPGL